MTHPGPTEVYHAGSDTPRTDAAQFTVWKAAPFDGVQDEVVPLAFARELERENAAFREAIESVSFLALTHPHLWNEKIAHAFVLIHRDDPVARRQPND